MINKAQYDLYRQTAKMSTLSSGNVSKYEVLNDKYVLSVNNWLEKAAIIKIFEYLLLGKELKVQTDIAKDQYKFFKDQMNFSNNNREGDAKTEDVKPK